MPGKVKSYSFDAEPLILERHALFVNTASSGDLAQLGGSSAVARAYVRVPRAGVITDISFVGEDGITQHGTNFQTFTGLNLGPTGTGNTALLVTTAHHNTTDINAAALNGGTDLTAKKRYALELSATAANLIVSEDDVLEITATASGSGAVVDAAQCLVKFRCVPYGIKPTAVRVGGSGTLAPSAIQVVSSIGGEALLQFSATNEAQSCRLDWGDQLQIDPTSLPVFTARLKVSAMAANTRMVWGLATTYNATLEDSVVPNCWFRLDGNSLALFVEGDDSTTDTDLQATTYTLTAATYNVYTIDFRPGLAHVTFLVDNVIVGTIDLSHLTASNLLQPFICIQKDSGTGAQSLTCDYVSVR